ncbi:MAG TPA: tyrosine-type recombinase/integrase [Polyangiaceae bacterium]
MSRLYKRGGIWWFQFLGKRRSTYCSDKVAASLVARDIERRTVDPTYRPPNHTTLAKALRGYVAQQTEREKAHGTLKMYERHIRHIARLLGGATLLASIGAKEIDGYVSTRLEEGAARSSVGKELSTIRGTLKRARRHGEYPLALDEVMPSGFALDYTPGTRHLREAEMRRLLSALPPARRAVVAFIVATGADWNSVERATRTDVNLRAGTVRVRGSKTSHRSRTVPILAPFADLARYAAARMPFEPWGNVRRDLEVACRRAKVPRVTPRDLRRTHGSILRQKGVEPHLIGKMLGHADSRMVERVYGQIPADALGSLIGERLAAGTPVVHGAETEHDVGRRNRGKQAGGAA